MSLNLTHKLALSFALVAVLVGGLGYLALTTSGWVQRDAETLGTGDLERAYGLAQAAQASQAAMQQLVGRAAEQDDDEAGLAGEAVAGHLGVFDRLLTRSREAGARADDVDAAFESYRRQAEEVVALSDTDPAAATALFSEEVEPFYLETLRPALAARAETIQTALAERTARIQSSSRWGGRIGLSAAVLVLLVVVALAVWLTRFVGRSLGELTEAALAIGEGRLDERVNVTSNDEIGQLGLAFNEMMDQFSSTTVSKGYVENIVQSMADPLVVVDPSVKISMVNQAALDLLGFERSDLLGKPVMTIFSHTGRTRGSAIKQTIEQALAGNVETSFRVKDGGAIPVSLSSALVREGEAVQGLVIVAKDITRQKQFETELIEAKEEAEQMVHLRDAFLANMSHEIRTPLTGILGSAQVLAEGLEGEHKNLAKIIEDAGTRLLDTINSVLEMARIEAGEVQPEVEVLNLFEEAEASARVLKHVADKRGLQLRVEPPAKPVYAQIDRSCLHRILNNLVGNAVKFTREGAISVEVEATEEDAILTVRDTGVGISKEFLPHLFDDFKQESTGLKRSHEGSGLGLAITKKLAEMMGGEISVESIKGIGSAFSITFPRVPVERVPETLPEAERPAPRPEAKQAADGTRYPWETEGAETPRDEPRFVPPPTAAERTPRDILLIEDNAQNAYMAQFMLQGFETDIATSPEEAIEKVKFNQYRVLLVDINLGADRSGIDLLHEMRGIEGYERVPAVAVTAYALPGDEDRFLKEGFDNYVAKPFRKEVLRQAVDDALAEPVAEPTPDLDQFLGGSFEEQAPFGDTSPLSLGDAAFHPAAIPPEDIAPPKVPAEAVATEAVSAEGLPVAAGEDDLGDDDFGDDDFDLSDATFLSAPPLTSIPAPPSDDSHRTAGDGPGGPPPAAG